MIAAPPASQCLEKDFPRSGGDGGKGPSIACGVGIFSVTVSCFSLLGIKRAPARALPLPASWLTVLGSSVEVYMIGLHCYLADHAPQIADSLRR